MTSDKKDSESNTVDFSNKAVWNRVFKDLGIIAFAGFVYYLIVRFTDFGIVCYVRYLTGYNCPACGSTRMVIEITKLNFSKAFHYNPYMFVTFPYVIFEGVYFLYILESKKKPGKVNSISLYIWTGLLIIFGIVRNIVHI